MLDDRTERDRVDGEGEVVPDAAALDDQLAALAGEDQRHGQKRLESVACAPLVGST